MLLSRTLFTACILSAGGAPLTAQFRCAVTDDPSGIVRSEVPYRDLGVQKSGGIITIPIVFHVIWHTAMENVSDSALHAQLAVLNQDLSRTNPDAVNTPADLLPIAAATNFQFCLADTDPNGAPTNGITRHYTDTVLWMDTFFGNDNIFYYATGGVDAWDPLHYMNVWVFNRSYYAGTASSPSSHGGPHDGVALDYPQALGASRALTHEIGHCFGLKHVFGGTSGEVSCGDDLVADTPLQTFHYDCPAYPVYSCGNTAISDLFMNYMDYSGSGCKNMLTQGQADRMLALFNQYRTSYLSSNGCSSVGLHENIHPDPQLTVSPNPTSGPITVIISEAPPEALLSITDAAGRTIRSTSLAIGENIQVAFDISEVGPGFYLLQVTGAGRIVAASPLLKQ